MYLNVKEQLCKELELQYLALTTDLWTSNATKAYLTVTAHYIDDNWRMVSQVLQTREMPEQHTGVNGFKLVQKNGTYLMITL